MVDTWQCICKNSQNFTAQGVNHSVYKLEKNNLGGWGILVWNEDVIKQIINVWNDINDGGLKNGADLRNFGNEWNM